MTRSFFALMGRAEQCRSGGRLLPVRRRGCSFVKVFAVYYANWLHIGYSAKVVEPRRFFSYGKPKMGKLSNFLRFLRRYFKKRY